VRQTARARADDGRVAQGARRVDPVARERPAKMAKSPSAFFVIRFSSSRAAITSDIRVRKKQTKNFAEMLVSISCFVR
jgi:hypothetical protein